jgi:hypothetical protein
MSDEPRMCVNCIHVRRKPGWGGVKYVCAHPMALEVVTGSANKECKTMRGYLSRCGEEGKWFEKK